MTELSKRPGPLETVRREVVEELGVPAQLDAAFGEVPFFLTMTETVGPPEVRHVDVSLWFALSGRAGQVLRPDEREFRQVRWWTVAELSQADLAVICTHDPAGTADTSGTSAPGCMVTPWGRPSAWVTSSARASLWQKSPIESMKSR